MHIRFALPVLALTAALAACQSSPSTDLSAAQYWQHANMNSAIYEQGPKAQQKLHRAIANCTVEVRELRNIGELRRALPADTVNGRVPDPGSAQGQLAQYDTPQKDGYLYAEYYDYHDFEGCMTAKGWERVQYMPYDDAEAARANYKKYMDDMRKRNKGGDREYVTSVHEDVPAPSDYTGTNN